MLLFLKPHLELTRCPHCYVSRPQLARQWTTETRAHDNSNYRFWAAYRCSHCGGLVTASAQQDGHTVQECYPVERTVNEAIPTKAREFLRQAVQSLHAPAGAVMLAASSVDAMLKEKGYKEGNLYTRINQAAKDHLITEDMSTWAHQVRLDANDQRHVDDSAPLPDEPSAQRCINFAEALAHFLFVLPSMVTRGLKESTPKTDKKPEPRP